MEEKHETKEFKVIIDDGEEEDLHASDHDKNSNNDHGDCRKKIPEKHFHVPQVCRRQKELVERDVRMR